MKYKAGNVYLGIILLIVVFNIFLFQTSKVNAFQQFGERANDGSIIQIFYNYDGTCNSNSGDIKLTGQHQDTDLLNLDQFCIYFAGAIPDNNYHLQFRMYEAETRTFTYQNDKGEPVSYNKTVYDKFRSQVNITFQNGQNLDNDKGYALISITNSVWGNLKSEDLKTMINVTYMNLDYSFYHLTDYSRVSYITTRGAQNFDVLGQILIFVIMQSIALVLASSIYFQVGNVWPKPRIELFLLAGTWLLAGSFIYLFVKTNNLQETMRQMAVFPIPAVSFIFAVFSFFLVPSLFRPKKFGEVTVVSFNIPYVSPTSILEIARNTNVEEYEKSVVEGRSLTETPRYKKMKLFSYYDKLERKQYARNPDSYLDLISRFLFGGLKIDLKRSITLLDENGRDNMVFVLNYEQKKDRYIDDNKKKTIYIGLFTSLLASIFFVFLVREPLFSFIPLIIGVSLITYFFYEQITTKYSYEIVNCSRNVLSAMNDAEVIMNLESEFKFLLSDNFKLHRDLKIQPYEQLVYLLSYYEKDIFPSSYEEIFGNDFENDFLVPKKNNYQKAKNKEALMKEISKESGILSDLIGEPINV